MKKLLLLSTMVVSFSIPAFSQDASHCVGYNGPGGPCSNGPGGGLYNGPGGGLYNGPGGGMYNGPGGGLYNGPSTYQAPNSPCNTGAMGQQWTQQNCPN